MAPHVGLEAPLHRGTGLGTPWLRDLGTGSLYLGTEDECGAPLTNAPYELARAGGPTSLSHSPLIPFDRGDEAAGALPWGRSPGVRGARRDDGPGAGTVSARSCP